MIHLPEANFLTWISISDVPVTKLLVTDRQNGIKNGQHLAIFSW